MPRLPRIDLPGIPQHVVQRGNDRQACFADEQDYRSFLIELHEAARKHDCAVHAYVLMTNHVHLLVTPSRKGALSRMMQAIGRRYVGRFNARYGRTGTLWEGRYKAALVDSERYVLACYRYIELNPVRARMVAEPIEYRWSSHACNAHGEHHPLITPHASYLALGSAPRERLTHYRALIKEQLDTKTIEELRLYTQQQRAWGSQRFQQQIEALTQRRAKATSRGRPKKLGSTDEK